MSESTFKLGKYTVRINQRPDNPAFPVYVVLIGVRFVGKQFSRPSMTDCEWHERQAGIYAVKTRWPEISAGRMIWNANVRRRSA